MVGQRGGRPRCLNRALYQSRLQELAQERGEDNPALVVELQRTLLTDIPPRHSLGERPLRRWALLPGALLLVVLSLGLYLKTSDIGQVLLWQQAERHFPALLQQVKDPTAAPLRMDELAELRLGLRSHLQDTPNDLAGWQLLGRLGLLLNDGETAIGAFGRAHALAADDPAAAFDYASALVRARDSGQVRMGELLLRDLHQRQPNSLPVLEMLTLSAVRNEDYPKPWQPCRRYWPGCRKGMCGARRSSASWRKRSSRRSNSPAALRRRGPGACHQKSTGGPVFVGRVRRSRHPAK
ncbi:cytochrome c heme lyase subunit CcmH [Klebsiella pneumoniae]|uniref:Cytochrome c heme lyase subunit CcmH n=1 Tax=Klebsiella pneumoniae TaxID=573 RepID=A0A377X7N2_KLEPN|nr:cytochrome c heme lyase subunit CcmH [Klebsiella pneumoniae]